MKPEEIKYIFENKNKKSPKEIAKDLGLKERKVGRFLELRTKDKAEEFASREGHSGPFYIKLLSIIFISCVGIIVYSNTFHSSFHFDDNRSIVHNSYIRNISNLQNIWDFWPCRFITYLSIALNYHFHQLDVTGYHIFNLAVHIGTAILVWWFVLLTFSTPAMKEESISRHANVIALLAGLVFVSHPVQTEAVTYICQRASSMAALFYLASLCFYVKSRFLSECHCEEPKGRRNNSLITRLFYFASIIMAILAMFTKENALTLPLMILLYEFSFLRTKKNINWKYLIPFLCAIFIIPLTMALTKSVNFQEMRRTTEGSPGISPMHYLLTQFRVMVTYIRSVFLPLNQNLDYDYPVFKSIFELPVLTSFLFLSTVLFFAKRQFLKYRLVSFSIFFFFLALLPESSFLPINDVIFEHRLYLPMVGYSMFLVSGVYYLFGKNSIKTMVIVLAIILTFNSILTYQRNYVWRDDFSLWDDTVAKSPHKARPYDTQGYAYSINGNFDKAISDFSKAIELNPNYAEAYDNRGVAYYGKGNYDHAISDYNKAIELNPGLAEAYNSRGVAYDAKGDFPQAISDLNKAIEINPNYAEAYNSRGKLYYRQGNFTQAMSDFNKAIEINPNYIEVYYNIGLAYARQGNYNHAISDCNKAIALNPNYADAYLGRGFAYSAIGSYDHAISDYNRGIELKPKYAEAYNNRGFAYRAIGNYDHAISDCNKAIALNPNYVQALDNRAIAYYFKQKYDNAWKDVRKAECSTSAPLRHIGLK